jgi:hypothetical protein
MHHGTPVRRRWRITPSRNGWKSRPWNKPRQWGTSREMANEIPCDGATLLIVKQIATDYFQAHPETKDGVMKAYYAYHAPHFRLDAKAHNFLGALKSSVCEWCKRTREDVRWDNLDPECASRPVLQGIQEVILSEEAKAFLLYESAKSIAPKVVEKLGLNGQTLAVLHHTHGCDPEIVASVIDVPAEILSDYYSAMELERFRSRSSQKKTVITVCNMTP